ncbi:MAG: gliding motility-associated C-terminal domain-containing protein [Cytophaga sp.]|uniref:gliding motility-associated C-terminal domain-containing protein n=1 Tax=Cytophaga sp. TaxID=29535 RepID=UPI003F804C43
MRKHRTERIIGEDSFSILSILKKSFKLLLFIIPFFSYAVGFAEGTKELRPTSADFGFLQIYDRGRVFATYNAPAVNRLNIHICTAGEKIFFGFKQPDNDVYFRLKDPSGNIVIAAQALPTSGAGFISTYNQAVAGPAQIVGAAGYNAMSYTSLVAGDYYLEFNTGSAVTLPANPANGNAQRIFDLFDVTVVDGTTIKPGRLWSYSWDINTQATTNPFTAKMYILSKDSIVTSIDFNGMQPYGAVITANSTGLSNTGNLVVDRASKIGDFSSPEYKIFLNDPDHACFPTGVFGSIIAPTVVTGCDPANRCINITVNKAGKTEIVLDLNGTSGFQPNTADRLIIADVVKGVNCVTWDSKDGLGNVITTASGIPLEVNYLNGITHLPLYDVEANPDGYMVELVRPAGAKPSLYWDDSAITAGTAIDGKVNLTGCSNASGCHKWKSRGNNSSAETINTWWYPNIVKDQLTFNMPDVRADADKRNTVGLPNDSLVCEYISGFQLSAAVQNSPGGTWTGGNGSFSPSRNVLNPVYTPTTDERMQGSIKLYLTSLPVGVCPVAKDSARIFFEKAPVINAGKDSVICSSNNTIQLKATISNAFTGIWTGGNGTFNTATNKNAVYTFAAADITAGSIDLVFTSTGVRLCPQEDDTIHISYTSPPVIDAGLPVTICFGKDTESITATGDPAAAYQWTGGNGMFSDDNQLTSVYTFAASEKNVTAIKTIQLTLTASKGVCPDVTDLLTITVFPKPDVYAGNDTLICAATAYTLSGSSTAASAFSWYTYPGNTILSTQQTALLPAITASGSYILKATDANSCMNTDTVFVDVYQLPALNPGGPYCFENGLTIDAHATSVPAVPAIYSWLQDNEVLLTGAAATTFHVPTAGTYTLNYKTTGCSKDAVVEILPKPVLTTPDSLFACDGSMMTLVTTVRSSSTYEWFDRNKQSIHTGNSTQVAAMLTPALYYVEETDVNGCTNLDSLVAAGTPLPLITISDAEICADSVAILDATPGNIAGVFVSSLRYEWKYQHAVVSTSNKYTTSVPGTYEVKVSLGGCIAQETAGVTVHELPVSTLPPEFVFCFDNAASLELNGGTETSYKWFPGNETTQIIQVKSPGIYEIELKNAFMCTVKAQTLIQEVCKPSLFVSSAFSPNNDKINDLYEIFEKHVVNYTMTIFNRWGEVIFVSRDKAVFWDGTYKGEVMPLGVYPYIIQYEGDSEEYKGPYILEGSVTLVK